MIKVWNVPTSECAVTLDTHEDKIWALNVAANGEWFVSGSGDGEVFVWRDHTSEKALEKVVCAWATMA